MLAFAFFGVGRILGRPLFKNFLQRSIFLVFFWLCMYIIKMRTVKHLQNRLTSFLQDRKNRVCSIFGVAPYFVVCEEKLYRR